MQNLSTLTPFSLTEPLSLSLHSQAPSPLSLTLSTLSLHYFTFITFAKRFDKATARCTEIVSNLYHRALSSFSLRGLSKLKKSDSLYAKCVSPFGCQETVGKIIETLVSIHFFFLFWFLYWISNRIVKKDRSFIVFWDWIGLWNQIMFLGLFIFAEDLILVLCWSKFTLI